MATPFDKLYWTRLGLGVAAGVLAFLVFPLDATDGFLTGVLIFLASYYLARYAWFKKLERQSLTKLYTTGIGGYIMLFLFTWIVLFTASSL